MAFFLLQEAAAAHETDRKRDSEQMATESGDDPQAGADTTLQSETGKAPERVSCRALGFFRGPRRSLIPLFFANRK